MSIKRYAPTKDDLLDVYRAAENEADLRAEPRSLYRTLENILTRVYNEGLVAQPRPDDAEERRRDHAIVFLQDFIAYEPGTAMRPQREKAENCLKCLVRALRGGE